MKVSPYIIVTCAFVYASSAQAQVIISEIMYDVSGSDDGREWVEVHNTGAVDLDLSLYRLYEGGVNHRITSISGGFLPASGYAIIADNSSKFLIDFPQFSGVLYDSAFSLLNGGEVLSLKLDDVVIDTVEYIPQESANGTGATLQKSGTSWVVGMPTPGAPFESESTVEVVPEEESEISTTGSVVQEGVNVNQSTGRVFVPDPFIPTIYVFAGLDVSAIAGAPVSFSGSATIAGKAVGDTARFFWNFGDGKTFIGKNTSHVYRSPGTYIATLTVSQEEANTTDMVVVTVKPSPVFFGEVFLGIDGFISLVNKGTQPVDISSWYLESGGKWFIFPPGTFLPQNIPVRFDAVITGLFPITISDITLRFPSGLEVSDASPSVSISSRESPPVAPVSTPTPVLKIDSGSSVTGDEDSNTSYVDTTGSESQVSSQSALLAETDQSDSHFWWYIALVTVLSVGAGSVLFVPKRKLADEFTIESDED